jgi:phage gp46-like protein
MSLPPSGAGLALTSAGNGRVTVQWSGGNPVFDDSAGEVVLSLLLEGPWFGDRAKKRRSRLPTVKTNDSSAPGRIVEYAKDAIQPAIADGRIQGITPSVQPSGSGYLLTVAYVTRNGVAGSISVPLEL